MQDTRVADLVRTCFAAYSTDDRALLERTLSDDFTFTSPYDDAIDKAEYFVRCWPNRDRIKAHHIENIAVAGDDAFVIYSCELKSGARFRNVERFTIAGDKVRRIEVYFGDPPSGIRRDEYLAFLDVGRRAWSEARADAAS